MISKQDSLQETFETDSDMSSLNGQRRKRKIKLLPGETREKAIERVRKQREIARVKKLMKYAFPR